MHISSQHDTISHAFLKAYLESQVSEEEMRQPWSLTRPFKTLKREFFLA